MKRLYGFSLVILLAACPLLSLEADPAPMRSITVFTADFPADSAGSTEIDLDEAFLFRLSPRFTLVGKAGLRRYAPDNIVPRAGVGAAWDFGGGFYLDGYAVLGWASALSVLEYETAAALNYETDSLYSSARAVLRSRQDSLSVLSSLAGRWTWPNGTAVQGMYSFAWEEGAETGHSLWVEAWVRVFTFLEPRLGGTISRETNGDAAASLRAGLGVLPGPDIKILCVVEPYFMGRAGELVLTVAVDVSIR